MDIDTMRSAITVLSFLAFIAIVAWAYSSRRKHTFDRVARSVLEENDDGNNAGQGGKA